MKHLILAAAAILFTSAAFADSTELPISEGICLNEAGRDIVEMLKSDGYNYQVLVGADGFPTILKSAGESDPTYTVSSVVRNGDLEEYYFQSDFDSASVYAVMKLTENHCESHAVGQTQDDGD